jgi:UDP-N-acetylmuramate dehydrogenase
VVPAFRPRENVRLDSYCTLGVGGRARYFVAAGDEPTVVAALAWARGRGMPWWILGGGSNVVVGDRGVPGLVVKMGMRGVEVEKSGAGVAVTAAAGEPWDDIVRLTVERGWAGLECLSGIPGLVGATPMQNVGAYGQEVSETVTAVRALDARTGEIVTLAGGDCGFAYRDSRFKSGEPGRWVVLAVTYRLRPGGPPTIHYADVAKHLAGRGVERPTVADVRASVLDIRRSKSMVLAAGDPNRRSCGSFFLNPFVSAGDAETIAERAGDPTMPRWPQPDGRVKLSAAWLIERAGFRRGHVEGPVGLSSRHALAIVAHDGARARDVVAFARRLQAAVFERFGVVLTPEPAFWEIDA